MAVLLPWLPARSDGGTGSEWAPVGPSGYILEKDAAYDVRFYASGRVDSLAFDPHHHDWIYLGSAGGGVWRSKDGGSSWTPLTDHEGSLGIGSSHAIAIDPNDGNTIYAGTTSFALLAQSLGRPLDFTQSRGILKSTDGGASWTLVGSGRFSHTDINTIIVDPKKSDVLYLAAGHTGWPYNISGGLYRSTDGGNSWKEWKSTISVDIYAESLVLDTSFVDSPSLPKRRVLYAGVTGYGVLRSKDGGRSWSPVLTAATPAVSAALPNGFTKVMVALAPTSNPPNPHGQVVYVSLLDQDNNGTIFMSTNGWDQYPTWQQRLAAVGSPQFPTLEAGFTDMAVDPLSLGDGMNDHIYWGGKTQYVSYDSGNCFLEIGQINGIHGDHQSWLLVPNFATRTSDIYAGDDGGVWKSIDGGAHWTGSNLPNSPPSINYGLQTAVLYALAVKPENSSIVLAASQDNGILRWDANADATWTGTSNDVYDVEYDRHCMGTAYLIQNGCKASCLTKSIDDGAHFNIEIGSGIPEDQRSLICLAVGEAQVLYVGNSRGAVYRSMDGGASFCSLTDPVNPPVPTDMYISSLDVAPYVSDNLVIAANNYNDPAYAVRRGVWVNGEAQIGSCPGVFYDITSNLPPRFVTRVAWDSNDPAVVYATLAGLGKDTPHQRGHVFRTRLDGPTNTWTDISPKDFDVPVNAIAVDGWCWPTEVLYIGTDQGVYSSDDGGANWAPVDPDHLPNAAVSDLALNPGDRALFAATWGRGVFKLTLPAGR
jgi:photosystem II stability/assembly factor-like uncharacterized protein